MPAAPTSSAKGKPLELLYLRRNGSVYTRVNNSTRRRAALSNFPRPNDTLLRLLRACVRASVRSVRCACSRKSSIACSAFSSVLGRIPEISLTLRRVSDSEQDTVYINLFCRLAIKHTHRHTYARDNVNVYITVLRTPPDHAALSASSIFREICPENPTPASLHSSEIDGYIRQFTNLSIDRDAERDRAAMTAPNNRPMIVRLYA